jgi:hypothetical protein
MTNTKDSLSKEQELTVESVIYWLNRKMLQGHGNRPMTQEEISDWLRSTLQQFEKQLREEKIRMAIPGDFVKMAYDMAYKEGYIAALAEVERWRRARIDYESSHMKEFIDALRSKLSDQK